MQYTMREKRRLIRAIERINKRLEKADYSACNYKDRKDLLVMEDIISKRFGQMLDDETFEETVLVLSRLCELYMDMARFGKAEILYMEYMDLLLLHERVDDMCEVARAIITIREKYGVDYAVIEEVVVPLVSEEIYDSEVRKQVRKSLQYDGVERTELYMDIVDEVEKAVEKAVERGDIPRLCHAMWSYKKDLLAAAGIEWCTPAQMNPRVMFD